MIRNNDFHSHLMRNLFYVELFLKHFFPLLIKLCTPKTDVQILIREIWGRLHHRGGRTEKVGRVRNLAPVRFTPI
jgi:hypothetical protein